MDLSLYLSRNMNILGFNKLNNIHLYFIFWHHSYKSLHVLISIIVNLRNFLNFRQILLWIDKTLINALYQRLIFTFIQTLFWVGIPSICSEVFFRNFPQVALDLLWTATGDTADGMESVLRDGLGELSRLTLLNRGLLSSAGSSSMGVLTLDLNLLTTFFRRITWLGVKGVSRWLTCS